MLNPTPETCSIKVERRLDAYVTITVHREWPCARPDHPRHQSTDAVMIRKTEVAELIEKLTKAGTK